MADLSNNVSKLRELSQAMSEYGQTLSLAVSRAHQIIEQVDYCVMKSVNDATEGANGWGLDREDENYSEKRRAMVALLQELEASSHRYNNARDKFLSVSLAGAGSSDCFAARASLEKLAAALEEYCGVNLFDDGGGGPDSPPPQKVKKRR